MSDAVTGAGRDRVRAFGWTLAWVLLAGVASAGAADAPGIRDTDHPRLHAALRSALSAYDAGPAEAARASGLPPSLFAGDRVLVEIRHVVQGRGVDALPGLRALDADIRRPGHRGLTEAWVPLGKLGAVSALSGVQQVSPVRRVRTLAGTVTTAGVAAGNVDAWHLAGLDGSGVTVAVIDRFDDDSGEVAALQASGDWPQPAQIDLVPLASATFGDGGDAHGNALLEVVFDLAPGADYIAYDVDTVGDWRDAIDLAVLAGADVIVSALAAPLDGIGDGSALPGSVAERVEAAATAGALYINAAGNERLGHWGGTYSPSSNVDVHTWSGANTRVNAIVDAVGGDVCLPDGTILAGELFWDDWTVVDHDYDLVLLELIDGDFGFTWTPRAQSQNPQEGSGGQLPQEAITFVASSADSVVCPAGSGRYGWSVTRIGAAAHRNLQFFSSHPLDHRVASRSLVFPADSPAALAVAAIDVDTSVQIETSSEGPILAAGGGLPTGAETPKPDLSSFAPAATVSLGVGGFGGTSSAAAHAAGMAALLRQRHPGFDRDRLAGRLRAIAAVGSNDLGAAGHDFVHGAGRLRFQAEQALLVTGSPVTTETDTLLAPVSVELRDDENEIVLSGPATQASVALGNDPSGGLATLSGTPDALLLDGAAEFTDLSIDEPGFAYTLVFSVDSDAQGAESDPFNVVLGGPGVPSQLIFTVQPVNTTAGAAIAPVVTVEVQDSEGVRVETDNSTDIELVLIDDPGGTGLAGNGPLVVSNGVAVFPALSIDRAGSAYRLRAQTSVFGLVGADSDSFDIVPGMPSRLDILVPPQNGEIGIALAPITVAVTDALGNAQSGDFATSVSVSLASGGGSLDGTLTRTVSAGEAVFDDLSIDTFGDDYTLAFRADIGELEERLHLPGFSLGGSESASFEVDGGLLNRALVRGLRFTGTVAGIGGNSSYASDLRMDVQGPSGSTFAVGGFNNAASVDWDFQGSISSSDGTYLSSHEAIFSSLEGSFTDDAGVWQFQFRNDWTNATATMHWSEVSVDLLKDDAHVVSAPFAVGGTEVAITLGDLEQTYDGTPRTVSVSTDPPGVSVSVTYDGEPDAPVLPGSYAVLAAVDEEGFFGSAAATLEVQPVIVEVTLEDLLQTYTGDPLSITVLTDPVGVAVGVTYDGLGTPPTDVGFYDVEATVVQEGHVGFAADVFEIRAPGDAGISFDNLAQTYDGTSRVVTVTTDPPGLAVEISYDGEPEAPIDAGTYSVLATVVEPGWNGSDSAELVVARAPTVTSLASDANPAPIGSELTLTAEVTGIDPGGTVSFLDGPDPIGGCVDLPLSGAGATVSAECQTALLPGGERALSAVYGGDANHLDSSDALPQTIEPYATSLSLDALVTGSDRGAAATFAATLSVPEGAVFAPAGSLQFSAVQGAETEDCEIAVAAAGSHACDITFAAPAAGLYEISVVFQPDDGNFAASNGAENGEHTVLRVADLALAKRVEPPEVDPGQALDFVIDLDNLGPDEVVATSLVDAMPAALIDPVWVCEAFDGAVCPNENGVGDIDESIDLPAGGALTYTISGTLDEAVVLPVLNEAVVATTAAGFTRDPVPGNNVAQAVIRGETVFADGFEAPPDPDED